MGWFSSSKDDTESCIHGGDKAGCNGPVTREQRAELEEQAKEARREERAEVKRAWGWS